MFNDPGNPSRIWEMNDEALAVSCLARPNNFSYLMARHEKPLRAFIYTNFKIAAPEQDDLVQETFLRAYLSIPKFNAQKKWKTWLYKIALNLSFSWLRKPPPESLEVYAEKLKDTSSPEEEIELLLAEEKIKKALNALSETDLFAIEMHFFKELSIPDMARLQNLPIYMVRAKVQAACKNFKRAYSEADF